MEKTTVLSKKFIRQERFVLEILDKKTITLSLIGFLLGRAEILQGLQPFGIGFLGSVRNRDKRNILIIGSIFLGILSQQGLLGSIPYGISLIMVHLLFQNIIDPRHTSIFKKSFLTSFIYLTISMIFQSFTEFYLYDIAIIIFESIVIFTMVYISSYSLPLILEHKNRRIFSTEEIICMAILMALALSGINEIYILELSIRNILAIFITLLFAYNGGSAIGATVGITLGLITSISTATTPPVIIGIFGFCGLLAGVFKDLGRITSTLGFIMGNAILTFYISGYYEVFIQFQEILLASGLFFIVPKTFIDELEKFCNTQSIAILNNSHSHRVQKLNYKKLQQFSNVFRELAITFEKISDKQCIFETDELTNMIQEIYNYACSNCGMHRSCWEKNLHATYRDMSDLLVLIEHRGNIYKDQLPIEFKKRCIHPKRVLEKMKHLYELSYLDMTWRKRFAESRELISEQFLGISQSIYAIANDLEKSNTFDLALEREIHIALDRAGLTAKNIIATRNSEGDLEINIEKDPCYCREDCGHKFIPVISQVVGKQLVKKLNTCNYQRLGGECNFSLVENNNYKSMTKIAQINKDGNILSGDNYTYMDIDEHQYMIALSDGMGSGDEAYLESNAAITILEKMMEAGMDKEVIMKTINNILMLKSSDEIFSSMDIALVNLRHGNVEFIKSGAAPGYIKRNKTEIIKINSNTLPIGIVSNLEYRKEIQDIQDGDFIIMVSDGVLEIPGTEPDWLPRFLAKTHSYNPQELADKILNQALQYSKNQIHDDMTVMVTKVWRTIEF